jgi:uncharacterized Zn finger protein
MARRRRRARISRFDDYGGYDGSGYGGWGGFAPYVPVAVRKAQAARQVLKLKTSGRIVSPVEITGRKIATTFWGTAWCDNLERYSDFANRIPRGRTYVRNGSVIDLQIGAGRVDALVSGSRMYTVTVEVARVPAPQWRDICARCAGGIDSLVELLQGRFSKGVMAHLCQQGAGLFPAPKEIAFSCSCPDGAYMCKHVAAVLYGVGARFDGQPELLFRLRNVDEQDLVAGAATHVPSSSTSTGAAKILPDGDLSGVFGVEFAEPKSAAPGAAKPKAVAPKGAAPKRHGTRGSAAAPTKPPGVKKRGKPAPRAGRKGAKSTKPPGMTPDERKAISARMREYWEARRKKR